MQADPTPRQDARKVATATNRSNHGTNGPELEAIEFRPLRYRFPLPSLSPLILKPLISTAYLSPLTSYLPMTSWVPPGTRSIRCMITPRSESLRSGEAARISARWPSSHT